MFNKQTITISLFIAGLCLSSCQTPDLTVYTRYKTFKDLASYHVQTPDPKLHVQDELGQSIIFEWFVPKKYLETLPFILCEVRLKNQEELHFKIPITCVKGHTQWDLTGQNYFATGGVFTFTAALVVQGEVRATATHPLYTPLINLHEQESEDESE